MSTGSRARKWLGVVLKGAITAGLIWFVLRDRDMERVAESLALISFPAVAAAFLLMLVQQVISAWRWIVVMRLFDDALPFPRVLRFFFEGLFFSQTLPSTVGGDGVRMYRVVKAGLPLGAGINGVLLDRIAGLFALLAIVVLTQPWLWARVEDTTVRLAFAGVIAVGTGIVAVVLLLDGMPQGLRRWRLARGMAQLSAGQRALFARPGPAAVVFGISFVAHLMMVTAIWVMARELELGVGFLDLLVLVPGVMLVAAVPVSIAGWGVRENVMVAALALVGAPEAGVLVLSILFGLIMLAIGLIGGALWFARPDHEPARVEALEEKMEASR